MAERLKTLEELEVKLDILCKKYQALKAKCEKMEQTERMLREHNDLLQKTIHGIKVTKAIDLSGKDIKEAKQDISRLIKEIDKCIALLSV